MKETCLAPTNTFLTCWLLVVPKQSKQRPFTCLHYAVVLKETSLKVLPNSGTGSIVFFFIFVILRHCPTIVYERSTATCERLKNANDSVTVDTSCCQPCFGNSVIAMVIAARHWTGACWEMSITESGEWAGLRIEKNVLVLLPPVLCLCGRLMTVIGSSGPGKKGSPPHLRRKRTSSR